MSNQRVGFFVFVLIAVSVFLFSCSLDEANNPASASNESFSDDVMELSLEKRSHDTIEHGLKKRGFVHGLVVSLDGEDYYFAGAPDGPNGEIDVPGHYWVQAGERQFVGKHYNTGPFDAPKWWSSDADDGQLLYIVHGIIDRWSERKAERYASRGYTHYHEFVNVADGSHHPTKVVWLKHIARSKFNFDGGPMPELGHMVKPGVDYEFMVNYMMPYDPDE
jgi:selenium-binding protein 1